jgi:CPA2 family monovalent cation:H+ antiporter-2
VILAAGAASPDLLIEIGALLMILAILARVANRVGLSPIPLYLLVGLAAGQGGFVDLDESREFIGNASQIGVVLLLFFLGLEYSARDLLRSLRSAAPSGLLDIVLNATPGAIAGLLLGFDPPLVVLLAGITYISSSGVVAKLLADLGRTGNRETPAVIAVLVFEDLVMAGYLPVVAVLIVGGTLAHASVSLLIGFAGVALVLAIAVRYGDRLSALAFSESAEGFLFGVLGATLLVAGLAERIQVSAAVGAFLVGIALSGPAAEAAHDLVAPLRDVFAAAFFLFFSLSIDPGDVPPALPVALALGVVTAATKVATGWWAAGRVAVGVRGRGRAGFALVARGEFSIILAGLATDLHRGDDLSELAACYVLLLALAGPVLSRFSDPITDWFVQRRRERAPAG